MFAVIIDPIRRDRHARNDAGLRGPCMGERIPTTRRRAGMFRDVADTQEQLKRRRERGEPKQKWRPAPDDQRYCQQDCLHEQKPLHCARGRLCAVAALGGQHKLRTAQGHRELRTALLVKSLPRQIT